MKRAQSDPGPDAEKRLRGDEVALSFDQILLRRGIDGFLAAVCRLYYNEDTGRLRAHNDPPTIKDRLITALGLVGRKPDSYDLVSNTTTGNAEFVRLETAFNAPKVGYGTRRKSGAGEVPEVLAAGKWSAYDDHVRAAANDKLLDEMNKQKVSQDALVKNNLNIKFIHVGQGDCTLIQTPGLRHVMIDCGSAGGIEECGSPTATTHWNGVFDHVTGLVGTPRPTLDILILTHPDKDHHNGFGKVFLPCFGKLGRVYHSNELKEYIDGTTNSSEFIKNCIGPKFQKRTALNASATKVNGVKPPTVKNKTNKDLEYLDAHGALVVLDDGACTIRILAGEVGLTKDNRTQAGPRNTASLVTLIEAFGKRLLICGDATSATERFLVTKYKDNLLKQPIDILRCSHHGSDEDCNILELATAVGAREVIVSAGQKTLANHGLPALEVMRRFWKVAASGEDAHNVWYWYKHSTTDTTRVNDNLYASTHPDVIDDREARKKKKVWTTGSNGTISRSFAKQG